MPTIKEVVKKCVGSIATVSIILNGKGRVGEEKNYTFLLGNLRLYKKYNNAFYNHGTAPARN